MKHSSPEAGGAFFIILIALAMLAALSFIVMQGNRTSTASLSADQARLMARDILAYSDSLGTAFQKLRLRGCTESQISVSHSADYSWASYTNATAPSDKSCHIFDPAGAAVNSQKIDPKSVLSGKSYYMAFSSVNAVTGIGTTAGELLFSITYLQKDVCTKINELLGITNPSDAPPASPFLDSPGWAGEFNAPGYTINQTNVNNKMAFCLLDTDGFYKYASVMLAR